jgi:hypothetical protein
MRITKVSFRQQSACVVAETSLTIEGEDLTQDEIISEATKLALKAQREASTMTMQMMRKKQ